MQAPLPTVGPSSVTTESQSIRVNADAFGVGLGQTIQDAGRSISHLGDVVYGNTIEAARVQNENTARDVSVATDVKQGDLQAEQNAKQGVDFVNSRAAYVASITKLRDEAIASQEGNPAVQKMLRDQLARTTANAVISSANRAASEQKNANNQSAQAAVTQATNEAAKYATDPVAFDGYLKDIRKQTDSMADNAGALPAARKLGGDQAVSNAIMFSVANTSLTEPEAANKILQQYKDQLLPADAEKAQRAVDQGLVSKTSRAVANDVSMPKPGTFASPDGANQAATYIMHAEAPKGSSTSAYKDTDGTWHIGYGSDTITTADGSVRKVQQGDHIEQADADRDIARRLKNQETIYVHSIGLENWQKLGPGGQAALQSVMWNYGEMGSGPAKLINAIKAGASKEQLAELIRNGLPGGRKQNLGDRRDDEASMMLGGSNAILRRWGGKDGPDIGGTFVPARQPGTPEQQLQEGAARAAMIAPGNNQLADAVEAHIRANISQAATDAARINANNSSTLLSAVVGDPVNNRPGMTLAQIQETPELFAKWNQITPESQAKLINTIARMQRQGDDGMPTSEQTQTIQKMNALSVQEPEEFLKIPTEEIAKLPKAEAKKLLTRQATVARQVAAGEPDANAAQLNRVSKIADQIPGTEPGLNLVQQVFGQAATPTGNPSGKPVYSDAYYQFHGALQDWAQQYSAEHKGLPPGDQEVRQKAAELLRNSHDPKVYGDIAATTGPGWLNKGLSSLGITDPAVATPAYPAAYKGYVPTYVPAKIKPIIVRRLLAAGDKAPTDARISQVYQTMIKGMNERASAEDAPVVPQGSTVEPDEADDE